MNHIAETAAALAALDGNELQELYNAVMRCTGTIYVCGNGGSHTTAQHWACDLTKAAGLRCVALGANGALLTAYANDQHYQTALAAELSRVARPGDLLICLSCSGTSPNIRHALDAAARANVARVLLTGRGAKVQPGIGVVVRVPSDDYAVIEDCHLAIGHWLTKEVA
jgi:D-sedoheptulose 7-phosphate isomerase